MRPAPQKMRPGNLKEKEPILRIGQCGFESRPGHFLYNKKSFKNQAIFLKENLRAH